MGLSVDISKKLSSFNLEVSFSAQDETLGILGSSGSGKSMTLRCIVGLETPDSGRIVLNDRVLFDSEKKINVPVRDRNIGFLFQNYALFPHMNVLQNVCFGLNTLPKDQKIHKAKEVIKMVHLEGCEKYYPSRLSGGQQQRIALARALVMNPELLLLDEPFSALDTHLRSQMEIQFAEILSDFQGTTLFATHNLNESYRLCNNLLVMENGRKIIMQDKQEIFKNPPTYTTAQLTGCKNLSRARRISEDTIEAIDWGCSLKVNKPIPKYLSHVGIRAHHLKFVKDSSLENVFPCWLAQTSETPHRISLFLSLNKPPITTGNFHLQGELYKEKWESLKTSRFPLLVQLSPDQLFLTAT